MRQVSFEWCPAGLRPWVFFAACVIPTCVAAAISMAVLERPFLKLKRFWSYGPGGLERSGAVPPSAAVETSAS
jgi:peptidoglycan/LPS O-acetylase OafA/YrhL